MTHPRLHCDKGRARFRAGPCVSSENPKGLGLKTVSYILNLFMLLLCYLGKGLHTLCRPKKYKLLKDKMNETGILQLEGTVANLRQIKPPGPGFSMCVTRSWNLVTLCLPDVYRYLNMGQKLSCSHSLSSHIPTAHGRLCSCAGGGSTQPQPREADRISFQRETIR